MSIRDFHAQLVSGNNKTHLLSALRKLTQISDPQSFFGETPENDWPTWQEIGSGSQLRAANPA
ncbi:MAG TPA: hypothetical protein VF756_03905 [Thermoanaerobaculia bacterium]